MVDIAAISNNNEYICSPCFDKTLKIWNQNNGEIVQIFEGHENWLTDCKISHKEDLIFTCSRDGTIKSWKFNFKGTMV